ncbi:MAG: UDP-N-acetylmuramoyl-L-alanyl-D-glutamate--2,6-diaminopimelate ligase [Acidobacteria bacterium]|nr:UDP-N-acetylmuramoyl-L-alanyl-D-glutamate--2,6-diaminopimelate ligase [Acidobacteriota bacterium]
MRLGDLVRAVPGAELHGEEELEIQSVAHDSRRCDEGSLFVAIQGLAADGNDFVEAAVKKSAAAVVSEQPPRAGVPWVRVRDAREALALLSAAVLDHPGRKLDLVGVTGTNGKTTTAFMIDSAVRESGETSGLVGTVDYRIGDRVAEAARTTPESSDLQSLLREMVDAGCRRAVLEVSSHALALKRVHGLAFRVAVFTNLSRDHLDFHEDMESYFAAKRILFDALLREDGHAVVNVDDDHGAELARSLDRPVLTCSLSAGADFVAEDVQLSLEGTRFRVKSPSGDFEAQTPLLGRFSVRNALCAFAAAHALGLPPDAVQRGLASLKGVPGRMERVDAGQDFVVLVDYAHTDDALRNLLESVRELDPRRLVTVFGCGGDRDRSKRPLMGAVAARLSDVVILTSDNPRSEPPEAILDDVRRGIPADRVEETRVIVDRREAITHALEMGREGVVVVIAGKGHETRQVLRDRSVPFDDRQVVRDVLAGPARVGGKR